ncbi:lipoprotein [Flavobacterium jejuense]|uniref:Type IV secretion system putative lipoprotein virB7 n=1 Tax=Flavobacterium jejuense TaxID=1544455 RepID=A0ABX0IWJ6_9FLAO|nr:membrane lipoprotein lipid attachment site-containing protein [Flavobacterium jejuense]NHN26893.1 lipoprotein [Flavobacterium jejuense]
MKKITFLISLVFILSSCSPKIVGEWNVSKYQTTKPGIENISLNNIGTMTFKSNNEGEKNLDYTVLGITKKDNVPFTWKATEKYITIDSENSDFAKTWIILESKNSSQIWKSTNGENEVQTIELTK